MVAILIPVGALFLSFAILLMGNGLHATLLPVRAAIEGFSPRSIAMLGAVLLLLALSSSYLRWIPVTSSVVCLALGIGLGTSGLGFLHLDLSKASGWMEHLTEVAVLFSLFFSGLKLRLPLHDRRWWGAFYLAGPVMLAAASEARKSLLAAMSSGSIKPAKDWADRISARQSSSLRPSRSAMIDSERMAASVRTQPGQTALTAIPRGPSSSESARINPILACFEAQ